MTPRDTPAAPTTEAGRAVLTAISEQERLSLNGTRMSHYRSGILAIEAEARAAARKEVLDVELAAIYLAAAMKECGYTATEQDARNVLDYLDGDNGVALTRSPHNREAGE